MGNCVHIRRCSHLRDVHNERFAFTHSRFCRFFRKLVTFKGRATALRRVPLLVVLPTTIAHCQPEGTGARDAHDNMADDGQVVMVTGGAGYLGQHIVRLLQERGENVKEIRVFDLKPYENKLGKEHRLSASMNQIITETKKQQHYFTNYQIIQLYGNRFLFPVKCIFVKVLVSQ